MPCKVAGETTQRPPLTSEKAKSYNRTKLIFGLVSSIVSFLTIFLIVVLHFSETLEIWIRGLLTNDYAVVLSFAGAVGAINAIVTFPLRWYSSYRVEHAYELSNQTPASWFVERTKGLLIGLPLGSLVVVVLFFCLKTYGNIWWLPVSMVLTLFSVILARIAPIIIMPFFFKFTPLEDGSLKGKITELCSGAGLKTEGVFSFNLSKNTKKANAAFTGIGKSKRVLLADTLLNEFNDDEITTVVAHELGHYVHHHITMGIVVGVFSTFLGLYITAQFYEWSLGLFNYGLISKIAALPLLGLWLALFGLITGPLGKMLSRRHERQADYYAVAKTENGEAFISALRKLAMMNLADPEPNPLVEFLFYSHPSVGKRTRAARRVPTQ